MRELTSENLRDIAIGAAVLGTGGGGNPQMGLLTVLNAIRLPASHPIHLVTAEELDADVPAAAIFGIGAPTVGVEKVRSGTESVQSMRALERHTGKTFQAIAPIEVGGVNSMLPLALGAATGLPVLDLDGMGRAFPEVQMVTYSIYGISASPLALADERSNTTVIEATDDHWMERLARPLVVTMGGHADAVGFVSTVGRFAETGIPGTITMAEKIGRVVNDGGDVWSRLLPLVDGRVVYEGKLVDIARRTSAGFARGDATFEGTGDWRGSNFVISFQNENLVALLDGHPVVTVPDLITVMDADSARPMTTEVLRYGMRVKVLAMPCHPKWRTPEALAVAGPQAFGYDFPYQPL